MKIETGNANKSEKYNGWIAGYFLEEKTSRKNESVEVKWINRKKGEIKKGLQTNYEATTIVILISGKLITRFPTDNREVILSKEGEYLTYNSKEGPHESETIEDTKAIVIKWPSKPNKLKI